MKKKWFNKISVAIMLVSALSTQFSTMSASAASVQSHFGEGFDSEIIDSNKWELANWKIEGDIFGCTWRPSNAGIVDGKLTLTLDNDIQGGQTPYAGAEVRSKDTCGYGLYQASMKPAKNVGVNSSFFTYTGPSDGNPWDEIDIEFLGKDTTKVQFNYYVNGQGGHEFIYDLGFDASQSYHTYSYEWKKDCIIWRVDGKVAHIAYGTMPSHEGKMMMNLWNAGSDSGTKAWLGTYDGKTPLNASYDWVAYDRF